MMNILVVDDEPIVGRALQRAFSNAGHSVKIAASGDEALEIWPQQSFDLVLLDVFMPGFTGPQVLAKLKEQKLLGREMVVLMTAHSTVKSRQEALQLGAHEFVQKPFDNILKLVDDLTKLVKKHGGRLEKEKR